MNGYYDAYDDVALEAIEEDEAFSEDDGELDLERGRGRRRGRGGRSSPRGARGEGYNQPRPSNQYVTQTQLQAVATRIGNDVKRLNEADKIINSRVSTADARLDRHAMAIKKESSARKKADAGFKNTLLLISAVQLFLKPKSVLAPASLGLEAGTKLIVEEDDFLKTALPIGIALFGDQIGGVLGGLESGGSSGTSSSSSSSL